LNSGDPIVGSLFTTTGDITTLNWIGVRPRESVERSLGFAPGRLAAGYWLLLLKNSLAAGDFEFGGTTLRSGGKEGLPGKTAQEEAARIKVAERIREERGEDGYNHLKAWALRTSGVIIGPNRLAKVLPVTAHDASLTSAEQYPMGGGGLQWNLKNPRDFLTAMFVDANGLATAPGFSLQLANAPFQTLLDNRTALIRYLEYA